MLSISNIGWSPENDSAVFSILKENNITGLEIAPSTIFHQWKNITADTLKAKKKYFSDNGFKISALQALLFGVDNCFLFTSAEDRDILKKQIYLNIDIANAFDAPAIVFGSPKNRIYGDLKYDIAEKIAADFFFEVGEYAKEKGVHIGIEHNPEEYGADFLTTAESVIEFSKKLNHSHINLHLDTGALIMKNENFPTEIPCHYHISAPFLETIENDLNIHKKFSESLHKTGYAGWKSIEMKNFSTSLEQNLSAIEKACKIANIYI